MPISPVTIQVIRDLWGELDNGRMNGLVVCADEFLETGILRVVAHGGLSCQVDSFALANGHEYRPWPVKQPPASDRISSITYRQMMTGQYEFHGNILVPTEPRDEPGKVVLAVERAMAEDMALIALALGTGLEWNPALSEDLELGGEDEGQVFRGRRPEHVRLIPALDERMAEQLMRISSEYFGIDEGVRQPVLGAMEWLRLGLLSNAHLVRFVCHWIAIEKLADCWVKRRGQFKSNDSILDEWRGMPGVEVRADGVFIRLDKDWPSLFGKLEAMSQRLNTFAWTKIASAFDYVLTPEASAHYKKALSEGRPSARRLRNDVAHGNVDEATLERRGHVMNLSTTTELAARDFIYASIRLIAQEEAPTGTR